MKPTQGVIRTPVPHDGYPESHDPPHSKHDCSGCDEFTARRLRNHRAGKSIGVAVRGREPQEPSAQCAACGASCFAAQVGVVKSWAWNHNVDRAHWAVEPRGRAAHPRTLCPRCRPAEG